MTPQHQGTLQRFLNLTMKQTFHPIKVKRGWGCVQTVFGVAAKCPLVVRQSGRKVGVRVNTTGVLAWHEVVYCRWLRDATSAGLAATAWGRARTPRRWTGFSFFLSFFVRCCCTNYSSQNARVSLRINRCFYHITRFGLRGALSLTYVCFVYFDAVLQYPTNLTCISPQGRIARLQQLSSVRLRAMHFWVIGVLILNGQVDESFCTALQTSYTLRTALWGLMWSWRKLLRHIGFP